MKHALLIVVFLIFTPALAAEGPLVPVTKAACKTAGGTWGEYGMAGNEMCDMPAKDAGKPCDSGKDCETNLCVMDKSIPAGQPPRGKCYERTSKFGCHNLFDKEAAAKGQGINICID